MNNISNIFELRALRKAELTELSSKGRPSSREIYVNQFKIDFQLQKFHIRVDSSFFGKLGKHQSNPARLNYFIVRTPFNIVIRDTNSYVEDECYKRWPELMVAREYSMEDLKNLQLMKSYINSKLNARDKFNILSYFYEKGYMHPYRSSHVKDFAWVKIEDVDCKLWNDKPHLELKCNLYFDFEQYIKQLNVDNHFRFEFDKMFTERQVQIYFKEPMPLILYYSNKFQTDQMIKTFFNYEVNIGVGSIFNQRLEDKLQLMQLWKYNKIVEFSERTVKVTITGVSQGMIEKIWKHKGKIAFGTLFLAARQKEKEDRKNDQVFRNGIPISEWKKKQESLKNKK